MATNDFFICFIFHGTWVRYSTKIPLSIPKHWTLRVTCNRDIAKWIRWVTNHPSCQQDTVSGSIMWDAYMWYWRHGYCQWARMSFEISGKECCHYMRPSRAFTELGRDVDSHVGNTYQYPGLEIIYTDDIAQHISSRISSTCGIQT